MQRGYLAPSGAGIARSPLYMIELILMRQYGPFGAIGIVIGIGIGNRINLMSQTDNGCL